MASLLRKPGFGSLPSSMKAPSSGLLTTIGYAVLYILVGAIAIFAGMMLLGIKINLGWFDFRSPYSKSISDSMLVWPPTKQYTNLTTTPTNVPNVSDSSYSATIDCVLYNTRSYNTVWTDGDGPYRHLFHRGSSDLVSSTVTGAIVGGCSASGQSSDLPPQGLPRSMNPGVFLDPNLNDVLIFVDTENASRESVRIVDLPLDRPFQLAVVVNNNVLEVYLNCRLEVTKVLKNRPRAVDNQWFGLAGAAAGQAQIQNLRVWPKPLLSTEINPLCPGLPNFSVKRQICDGSDLPVPAKSAKEPVIDLGFNAALSKCP